MARRRRSSGGWSSKTYRSPAWKYFHPVQHLRSEYRKAKRAMRPGKVFMRVTSLDEVAKLRHTQTKRVNAQSRRADLARAQKQAVKKTAAKKATGRRPDPYAVAAAIPGQNRRAGAQIARAAAQPGGAKKQVPRRKNDGSGQFDGSRSMSDRDRAAWQNALNGGVPADFAPRRVGARRTPRA
jgi:hypothetical protein